MTLERKIAWLFMVNAVINWTISIRGIFSPIPMTAAFGFEHPPLEYTFVVRLWQGFVFMFGCMFWEVSRDVRGKAALIKYNWIEKTITALAVTLGFLVGEAPARVMLTITLTNWAWIPFLFYYDMRLRGAMARPEAPAGVP